MYFDTHAHYDDSRFDADRDELFTTLLPAAGVDYVLNCSADMKGARASAALSRKYERVYASVGIHPSEAAGMVSADLDTLAALAEGNPKCVAFGEIGLDYHYAEPPKETQIKWFKEQLGLAMDLHLPLIIHSRDAAQDTFEILKDSGVGRRSGGVIHCYSGSAEMAEDYVRLGFFIGVGGVVTYKNGRRLAETVERVPLERIVLETDAPYLAPEPHRGERNDSRYLEHVCAKIAMLKGVSHERVAEQTMKNAFELYNIRGLPISLGAAED